MVPSNIANKKLQFFITRENNFASSIHGIVLTGRTNETNKSFDLSNLSNIPGFITKEKETISKPAFRKYKGVLIFIVDKAFTFRVWFTGDVLKFLRTPSKFIGVCSGAKTERKTKEKKQIKK